MSATPTADGQTVTIAKRYWHASVALADIPGWIEFYRRLRDRKSGAYAHFFTADVAALEAVQRAVRQ